MVSQGLQYLIKLKGLALHLSYLAKLSTSFVKELVQQLVKLKGYLRKLSLEVNECGLQDSHIDILELGLAELNQLTELSLNLSINKI